MKKRIGELLVEAGACSENDVREALGHQRAWASNQKLGEVLVAVGKATPTAVARALSLQFDIPFISLPQIPEKVSKSVPFDYQEQNKIVPFRLEVEGKSERLHIAVSDPSNLELVDELRFELRKTVRVYVAATDDIAQAIATMKGESLEEIAPIEMEEENAPLEIERSHAQSAPQGWFGGDKAEEKAPAADLPEEWSLGPSAAEEPKPAAPAPPPPPPIKTAATPSAVSSDLNDLFAEEPEKEQPPPAAADDVSLPSIDLSADEEENALPAEPPTEPNKQAPLPEEVHPFSAVVEPEAEESWGALLPGGSGTSPSVTTKSATPSVSAPPTQPPKTQTPSGSAAPAQKQSVTAQSAPESKPSAAATTSAAVSPTSTPPPNGAVMNKAEPSRTAAPATEGEPPRKSVERESPVTDKLPAIDEKPTGATEKEKFEFSEDDLKILEDIERLADGESAAKSSLKVQPAQMVASLIRLLIKKGVIHELEFLDELSRK